MSTHIPLPYALLEEVIKNQHCYSVGYMPHCPSYCIGNLL